MGGGRQEKMADEGGEGGEDTELNESACSTSFSEHQLSSEAILRLLRLASTRACVHESTHVHCSHDAHSGAHDASHGLLRRASYIRRSRSIDAHSGATNSEQQQRQREQEYITTHTICSSCASATPVPREQVLNSADIASEGVLSQPSLPVVPSVWSPTAAHASFARWFRSTTATYPGNRFYLLCSSCILLLFAIFSALLHALASSNRIVQAWVSATCAAIASAAFAFSALLLFLCLIGQSSTSAPASTPCQVESKQHMKEQRHARQNHSGIEPRAANPKLSDKKPFRRLGEVPSWMLVWPWGAVAIAALAIGAGALAQPEGEVSGGPLLLLLPGVAASSSMLAVGASMERNAAGVMLLACFASICFAAGTLMDTGGPYAPASPASAKQWVNSLLLQCAACVLLFFPIACESDIVYRAEAQVHESQNALSLEEHAAERMLNLLLPSTIVDQIKDGRHRHCAEKFADASVLFAEIDRFDEITAEMSPKGIVDFLNRVFTCMDNVLGKTSLLKVETVGATYMVASGLPIPRTDHAKACTNLAMALASAVESQFPGVSLRIGIASGTVLAGVIGVERPRYRLFGDTVNTASRMETSAESGRIQVTNAVATRLERFKGGHFQLEHRGKLPVKGKGEMDAYYVVPIQQEGAQSKQISQTSDSFPSFGTASTNAAGEQAWNNTFFNRARNLEGSTEAEHSQNDTTAANQRGCETADGDECKQRRGWNTARALIRNQAKLNDLKAQIQRDKSRIAPVRIDSSDFRNKQSSESVDYKIFADDTQQEEQVEYVDDVQHKARRGSVEHQGEHDLGGTRKSTNLREGQQEQANEKEHMGFRQPYRIEGRIPMTLRFEDEAVEVAYWGNVFLALSSHIRLCTICCAASATVIALSLARLAEDPKKARIAFGTACGVFAAAIVLQLLHAFPARRVKSDLLAIGRNCLSAVLGFSCTVLYTRSVVASGTSISTTGFAGALICVSNAALVCIRESMYAFAAVVASITYFFASVLSKNDASDRSDGSAALAVAFAFSTLMMLIAAHRREQRLRKAFEQLLRKQQMGELWRDLVLSMMPLPVMEALLQQASSLDVIQQKKNHTEQSTDEQSTSPDCSRITDARRGNTRSTQVEPDSASVPEGRVVSPGGREHAMGHKGLSTSSRLAWSFDEVAVIQSDIVRFTDVSSRLDPKDVVLMLHSLFASFDAECSRLRGVHKIETIGDGYIAAANCVENEQVDPVDACVNIVRLALRMQHATAGRTAPDGTPLALRVGVANGPAVAGVVGESMLRYHLFGHTLRTAATLERTCARGMVHVSSGVARRILQSSKASDLAVVAVEENAENGTTQKRLYATWHSQQSDVGIVYKAEASLPSSQAFTTTVSCQGQEMYKVGVPISDACSPLLQQEG